MRFPRWTRFHSPPGKGHQPRPGAIFFERQFLIAFPAVKLQIMPVVIGLLFKAAEIPVIPLGVIQGQGQHAWNVNPSDFQGKTDTEAKI